MTRLVAASICAALLVPGLALAEKKADATKSATKPDAKPAKAPEAAARHVKVGVTEAGFEPAEITAKPNEALVLDVTRVTDETCATAIVIKDQNVNVKLPLNKEVEVPVKAGAAGRVAFACPMNMVQGAIVVKE